MPDVDVVEGGLVDPDREGGDRAGLRLNGPEVRAGREGGYLRALQGARTVDDARHQGVLQGCAVTEVDDRQRVDVRTARLPVVLVPDENAALAGGEGLVLERPGSVRLARIEAGRHDVQVIPVGELVDKTAVGAGHGHLDGVRVKCLESLDVDGPERR